MGGCRCSATHSSRQRLLTAPRKPSAPPAVHKAYTLTPYTLHPTPCILHPTPYTLHSTPHKRGTYPLHPVVLTVLSTTCSYSQRKMAHGLHFRRSAERDAAGSARQLHLLRAPPPSSSSSLLLSSLDLSDALSL